jgi:hypothetical protein
MLLLPLNRSAYIEKVAINNLAMQSLYSGVHHAAVLVLAEGKVLHAIRAARRAIERVTSKTRLAKASRASAAHKQAALRGAAPWPRLQAAL